MGREGDKFLKGSWDSCGSTFHIHCGNGLRMEGGNEIILSDGGGGGGGEDWQTRVFRKCLQKLLCVIGRAHRATFAVWFEKFSSSKMRCVPFGKKEKKKKKRNCDTYTTKWLLACSQNLTTEWNCSYLWPLTLKVKILMMNPVSYRNQVWIFCWDKTHGVLRGLSV